MPWLWVTITDGSFLPLLDNRAKVAKLVLHTRMTGATLRFGGGFFRRILHPTIILTSAT
jgi:hypothetical protein